MKIAHVANFYGPRSGGLRTAVNALGRGYAEHGHHVLIVVPGARDGLERTASGTRVTIRSPLLPGTGNYRVITRLAAVRDTLERFAPDILEVSDRTTLSGLGSWAAPRGIPTIFFAHERVDGLVNAYAPATLRPRGKAPARWWRPAIDTHNAAIHARFTTVVCTTQFAAAEFSRLGLATRHVPLGVDLDRFDPGALSPALRHTLAPPDHVVLVMATRLAREKQPELAIDAARLLHSRGVKATLVVAGAGPLQRSLRTRAAGIPVRWCGFIDDQDQFAALLATADVAIAPGPIETFGLAAVEALACGTPVVVNAASALSEVVGHAGIAARGTPGDMATAISALLARDSRVRRERARLQAESMPWTATVERMLAIHQDLHTRHASRTLR
ncbi:glycosyltransferase [Demequina sp. B12]|uniref:glycosyltransferase n=1 Tax=Demequina sp. B12 TaxID=2992757 RepID=UPI00237B0CEC|nr:glycosyltransferase [Demequina sp. B12]MDE0572815.1 glycosyltransferase [Demequina sp. B12]